MGVTEWCWTDYPEPQSQRSGWLEACGWVTCIDPLPSAKGKLQMEVAQQMERGTASGFEGYRWPETNNGLYLSFRTFPPAKASVTRALRVIVPKDCGRDDDIIIFDTQTQRMLMARIEEVTPTMCTAVLLRVRMFAQETVSNALAELKTKAEQALKK